MMSRLREFSKMGEVLLHRYILGINLMRFNNSPESAHADEHYAAETRLVIAVWTSLGEQTPIDKYFNA